MKGSHRHPPAAASNSAPLSPNSKATAKYTNKDGSKFITVSKATTPIDSSQPSPTAPTALATSAKPPPQFAEGVSPNEPAQVVNRKKQKRRAKAAAKAAAEQASGSDPPNGLPSPPASHEQHSGDADADDSHDDGDHYDHYEDDNPDSQHRHQNGYAQAESAKGKKSKKKKKKSSAETTADHSPNSQHNHAHPAQPRARASADHHPSGMSREKIWNTSSQEERERIKEFWLGLSEVDRKSLVKVEKDAVLKKMKEQQKHTCSCTVCGRKRTAIEEELEGLYDAYYEELEQYANQPDRTGEPPLLSSHQRPSFGSVGGIRPRGLPASYTNHQPSHGRIIEQLGDDEEEEGDGEEDFSEEDDLDEDDEYSDEEPSEELHRSEYATEFFNFGNSLTVQGGILTVADDLLKNDGKKFIEMMEQLAERRMAREEESREQFERNYDHVNGDRYNHTHPPPEEEEFEDDEEDYEEEDEEEYDSQEEEDTMTEEQRMEEGRRMFQIFAARMFEQRVLTAYREKVAKERQAKLLEEIDDENRQESQRKAKKAKEAQKRKDKAAKKKEAQAEEKARREAEKAAEEADRLAEEMRRAEEQRAKAEERRKKREVQKKAEEEDRQRKEVERLRRLHEREETERKAREAREREKKARDEARFKEKEQKEREARERREQQERDKRDKEARARADREARVEHARDARDMRDAREARETKDKKEKPKQEERAAHKAAALAAAAPVPITLAKRPAPHQISAAIPALPQQPPASFASPQISVATPAFPKAPTPMRIRQASQQDNAAGSSGTTSQSGSAPSQNPSPHPITPIHASPGPIGPLSRAGNTGTSAQSGPPPLSHSASPLSMSSKVLPPPHQNPFGVSPIGLPFGSGAPAQIPIGFGNPMHRDPMFTPHFQHSFGPPGHIPPGFGGRVGSGSYDANTPVGAAQPFGRPAPIGRPASVVQGQQPPTGSPSGGPSRLEPDAQLGSSALLDGMDEPYDDFPSRITRGPMIPTPGLRPGPGAFSVSAFGMDPMLFGAHHNPWGPSPPQHNIFLPPPPPGFGPGPMPVPWGAMPLGNTFAPPGMMERNNEPRYVVVRKMLRRACEELAGPSRRSSDSGTESNDGFISLDDIKAQVELFNQGNPVEERELLDICETEGNDINGGGAFDLREDDLGRKSIRWDASNGRAAMRPPIQRAVGAPGDIGSPIVGGGR
ncbi:salt tolerance down-regulator-domain-containing protein [Lasiosphaeria hispida]|uniref:Stress response protein NST1 n=1 Tax=Lasiosphaeria hispida TaxID=260671 RepID=A0AAJ0ME80_9PEZI|nr:salt tolerance down-regulator-domain-containing protein [Lasiosphaeria hispida]